MMQSEQETSAGPVVTHADRDTPVLRDPSLAYVKIASAILFAGALVFILGIRLAAPEQTTRYLGPILAGLIAAVTWGLASTGRTQPAVYTFCIGAWMVTTGIATYLGGVRSVVVYAYPVNIVLIGWLIGTRSAVTAGSLTVLALVGFVLGDVAGVLPKPPPTSSTLFAIVQILVVVLATVLVVYLLRAFGRRQADLVEIGDALASRTTELEARTAETAQCSSRQRLAASSACLRGHPETSPRICHAYTPPTERWRSRPERRP
jgi:hypothetical protein